MAAYYADTSALVKRYVQEPGTDRVTRLVGPRSGNEIITARITGVELVAALVRKLHDGALDAERFAEQRARFSQEWTGLYRLVEVTVEVVDLAMKLVESRGLRGYDAVHLAAALLVQDRRRARGTSPLTFVSADERQLAAARVEGLLVENPERHRAS